MKDNEWLFVSEPDNPMCIRVSAITVIVKLDEGCVLHTSDGSKHHFHTISYEAMRRILSIQVQ